MWKSLKAIADSLDALRRTCENVLTASHGDVTELRHDLKRHIERVDELERKMRAPLIEAEALLAKAESRFRSARSAEERARRYERDSEFGDEDDDEGDEFPVSIQPGMGRGSGGEAMQPVHEALTAIAPTDGLDAARRAKFAR